MKWPWCKLRHTSCDEWAQALCANFVLQAMNAQGLGTRLPTFPCPTLSASPEPISQVCCMGHWLLTETWFSSSYYVCVFHRLTCCVLRLMLSRTFSPVWETTLIHHFNYTLVIFIREWWWRLPKILLRGLPSMLRLTWDLWYGRQGWLHYISLVHVK